MSLFALAPEQLGDLFDQIPVLSRRLAVADVSGGLTNRIVKVTTPDGVYVARCSDRDANPLGIDRDAEHHNSQMAERAGVGAPVIDYRPDLGVLVIGWLEGVTLGNDDFGRPDVLSRAAAAVRRLHAGPRFRGDFDMFERQVGYLATVHDNGFALPDGYLDHDPAFQRIRQALSAHAEVTVPCNNDLLAANFVDDGRQVWLIDYEYAGNNDACFELGNTVQECRFDHDRTEALVAAYFGEVTRERLARVRLQAVVAQYGWSLWGCIQAASSTLDFDFWGWGVERYEGAVAAMRGPDFETLLDDAGASR